eukprot:UN09776
MNTKDSERTFLSIAILDSLPLKIPTSFPILQ